jgi:hypothetical protein
MDGIILLCEARAAGLRVAVDGEQLRIYGPRKAHEVAQQLLASKTAVVEALQGELPSECHFRWDERAAILEVDGNMARERAEAVALAEILDQTRRES